ncbi:MAG: apolipoprotein N-acyltransferase [Puniceicoccaceae bacterium]
MVVAIISAILTSGPFLNPDLAELAWIGMVPLLLWLSGAPRWKTVWVALFFSGWLGWAIQVAWLRHVTWLGTGLLAAILSFFWVAFFAVARQWLPKIRMLGWAGRLFGLAALGAAFVLLEWIRTWLLWGFPWNPLAASQWQRPVMLSILPLTGSWGLSWLIVFFNLAVTSYVGVIFRRQTVSDERSMPGASGGLRLMVRFRPEFYLAIGLIFFCFHQYLGNRESGPPTRELMVGLVQPDIPQELKWDTEAAVENLEVLINLTRTIAAAGPDLILWPESATPWPVAGRLSIREVLEELVEEIGIAILMGNMVFHDGGRWENGVFLIRPDFGLESAYYAKRKLVPFGEYNPLRGLVPGIEIFVPFSDDAIPGTRDGPLAVAIAGGRSGRQENLMVGNLICYEDIFPRLARRTVRAGAEVLFVASNMAWYGTERAGYQHAAHSVLRAAETGVPVIRVGNNGWSGWIDERGHLRQVVTDPDTGSIYTRQVETTQMAWTPRLEPTAYVQYGDWFVLLCGGLVGLAGLRFRPKRELKRSGEATAAETDG